MEASDLKEGEMERVSWGRETEKTGSNEKVDTGDGERWGGRETDLRKKNLVKAGSWWPTAGVDGVQL